MEESITRKPFKSGGSTAIRFPKDLNVEITDEIEISMPEDGVIVMKVLEASWEKNLPLLLLRQRYVNCGVI